MLKIVEVEVKVIGRIAAAAAVAVVMKRSPNHLVEGSLDKKFRNKNEFSVIFFISHSYNKSILFKLFILSLCVTLAI